MRNADVLTDAQGIGIARCALNSLLFVSVMLLPHIVAVIVAFVLCWAPFHAQRLMTVYIADDQWTSRLLYIESQLFYISGQKYHRYTLP